MKPITICIAFLKLHRAVVSRIPQMSKGRWRLVPKPSAVLIFDTCRSVARSSYSVCLEASEGSQQTC